MLTHFRALFPETVAVAAERIEAVSEQPLPEAEARAVAQAVASRRREFAAGRACARAALRQLGLADAVIPAGADRAPCWPDGYLGSITHSGGISAAAVGRDVDWAGIGLDLEQSDRLRPELWRMVLRAEEREWIERRPEGESVSWATLIFSAKEAFFKFQYPLTGRWVGFQEASIVPEIESGVFRLTLAPEPAGALGREQLAGRFGFFDGLVASGMAYERTAWLGM